MLSLIRSWWQERKLAGLEVLIATPAFGYLESAVVGQNVWMPGAVQLLREIRSIRRAERLLRIRSLLPAWRYTQTNVAHFLRLDARMDAFSVARWRRLDLERSILVRLAARKAVLLQLADAAMPASAGDRCARARFLFWLGEVALSRAARTERPLVRMDSWLRHVRRGAEAGSCWKSTAIVLASAVVGVCVSAITSITVAPNAIGLVPLGVLLLVVLGETALTLLQFRHARQRKRSTARSAARPGCVATFYPILLHSPWQLSAFLTLMSRNLRASACCSSVVVSVDMAGSLAKTQIGAQMMVVLQQEMRRVCLAAGVHPLLLRHRQQWLPDHGGWASPERKRGKVRAVVALAQGLAVPGVELVDGSLVALEGVDHLLVLDEDSVIGDATDTELAQVASAEDSLSPSFFSAASSPVDTGMECGDFWFDHFGDRPFTGKGLVRIEGYLSRTAGLPFGRVLSHDWVEGFCASTANVGSACIVDAAEPRLVQWLLRLHRWARGDAQNLLMILMGRLRLRASSFRLLFIAALLWRMASAICFPLLLVLVASHWPGPVVGVLVAVGVMSSTILATSFGSMPSRILGDVRRMLRSALVGLAILDAALVGAGRIVSSRNTLLWDVSGSRGGLSPCIARVAGASLGISAFLVVRGITGVWSGSVYEGVLVVLAFLWGLAAWAALMEEG